MHMAVPVVQVRKMRVPVPHPRMDVPVRVRLAILQVRRRDTRRMVVPMVLVVPVAVLVLHRVVQVVVLVPLR